MAHHSMRLASEYFKKIAHGKKTVEVRLFDEKRKLLKIGDTIEFTDAKASGKKLTVQILALHLFPSFSKLYNSFPMNSFGESKDEFIASLKKIYSNEEEQQHGALAIEFKVIVV